MDGYKKFALVYDDVMGDRRDEALFIHKLIRAHNRKAKSLLELGCGTGSLLSHLSSFYKSTGVDLSKRMLVQARRKIPKATFLQNDITNLQLNKKFDVIICVFDTINHITSMTKWNKIFKKVSHLLSQDGIFIFDINTVKKIQRYSKELPYALEGKNSTCIVNVTPIKNSHYTLEITAYSRIKSNKFEKFKISIPEITFSNKIILKVLNKYFKNIILRDPDSKNPSNDSEDLYFICSNSKTSAFKKNQ